VTVEQRLVRVEFPAVGSDGVVDGVALVVLDRPDVLNALSSALMAELVDALDGLDRDPACRCIVLTGAGERAFAAGADIKEMVDATPVSLTAGDSFGRWERIGHLRTPLIAAVRGFALGGGCELAMSADMIVAGDDATFGQPEISIGVIPGAGGTQRLTRAIGKARAMEMILTGRRMGADEALAAGLVTRVVPAESTVTAALELAARVADMPPLAVAAAKASVQRAFELPLSGGLDAERRAFYLLFSSNDQKEGMAAFIEKRPPEWTGS
jgi:enoyl-CoA hydratase